jgi:hypothetical protein
LQWSFRVVGYDRGGRMSAAEQWMSLRAYGRRRGVELSAVQKAIASWRVTAVRRKGDRLVAIEAHAADAQWLKNTDPVESARTTGTLAASAAQLELGAQVEPGWESNETRQGAAVVSGEGGNLAPAETGKDFGYLEHRAKREQFQAKQAELDYLEAIGELVPKAELLKSASSRYRAIRDKLLGIPDRNASMIVGEARAGDQATATARVHALLVKEIKQVLHELSDDARAAAARGDAADPAARGAAERVAA